MRHLSCVSLVLLLGVLMAALISPVVATAPRELLAAATGDQGLDDRARRVTTNILITNAPPEVAVEDAAETTTRRRRRMDERFNYRRFGTRKVPSSSSHQASFGGRIPFTADYGRIKRHPPKHN